VDDDAAAGYERGKEVPQDRVVDLPRLQHVEEEHVDLPVGASLKDAAPDARPHQQAQNVQQERDREREQPRVAKAIAVCGRRIAQLFQGVLHLVE